MRHGLPCFATGSALFLAFSSHSSSKPDPKPELTLSMSRPVTPLLDQIRSPQDLRRLSDAELARVADELRAETIWVVSQTGGHLGAGLGVVELTVALHAVFDTPRDRLIWDVGHQAYPHKILTGRRERMLSLRQKGGLSGFTKRSESVFDPFGAGHSSTSISAALGFKVARDLGGAVDPPLGDVIAVIGDGAMSAGMAFEALNHAGHLRKRLFVILNDNEMSIAPPVGALSAYLSRLYAGAPLEPLKAAAKGALALLPPPLVEAALRAKDALKHAATGGGFFESLGFSYFGPIDGHDLGQLLPVLRTLKERATGPVLLHVITKKGKGFAPAERAPDRGHARAKFDPVTGEQVKAKANAPTYTRVFAETLIKLAERDEKIVAITAAMPDGTGLDLFARRFPERCFDVGIAEQHAVTFAAGLAAGGLRPFCAIYSTFLQRAYDQVIHDVALQKLPVRFAIDRAGIVGQDGPTHAGAFDIAFLGCLPGFVLMAAADEAELARMVATAAAYDLGPIAFRYPRGEGLGVEVPVQPTPLSLGVGRILREGGRVALLSYGARLSECLRAAEALESRGLGVTVADARFAKPLDTALIDQLARHHEVLLTIEEGSIGGFGSLVAQHLAETGIFDRGLKFRSLVLPDRFIEHGTPREMYEEAGLNAPQIEAKILALMGVAQIGALRA